jgi:HD-like signal output (HDOD) protein
LTEKLKFGSSEEVFICALLHNLGKHLVICYFPEEYEEIKNIITIKDLDEQSASKSVLGVSFSELGMGVTRSWSFPQRIIDSMDVINNTESKASKSEADVLKNLANYASELCSAATQTDPSKRNKDLQAISDKYKISVPFPQNLMMNLINDAANTIDQYAEMFRINKKNSPLLQRLVANTYREEKSKEETASELNET